MAFNEKNKHHSWSYEAKHTASRNRVKRQANKRQRQITKERIDSGYYGFEEDSMAEIAYEEIKGWYEYETQDESLNDDVLASMYPF